MNKVEIKSKIIKAGKAQYLSAQEYAKLSNKERQFVQQVVKDEGLDADDYDRKMKKLFPAVFVPKPLVWRNK